MTIDRGGLPNREGAPKARVDVPGVVGQFLGDLAPTDLVVELVQNDLDAGATATTITFGREGLTSEGNGAPIDDKGWTRLEYVLGAGGEIEAKKDGIGSKNHGLRSVFLIADEIGIQSRGLRVDLTTRGLADQPAKFFPAAWNREEDSAAPPQGTRVTAPYRTRRIRKPDGDSNHLEPPTGVELDDIWAEAIREAPQRFICASAPSRPWRYDLTLVRSGRPSETFIFECRPLVGVLRGLYLRTCKVKVEGKSARIVQRRHCARFLIDPDDLGQGKVPKLFRSGRHVYGELSWIVDTRDRPQRSTGLLRYPIAFPPDSALTGAGFDISAPFTAGRARHSLSDDKRNELMVLSGRKAFASLAGERLAKVYGPRLGVLASSSDHPDEPRANEMAAMLLKAGGLSVAIQSKDVLRKVLGSAPMDSDKRLTLAASIRTPGKVDRRLCSLAPSTAQVLHPDTPAEVVNRLVAVGGSGIDHFNEEAAARQAFVTDLTLDGAVSERQLAACGEVLGALEALRRAGGVPQGLVTDLKKNGKLPTADGMARAWSVARRSSRPVPTIPGRR